MQVETIAIEVLYIRRPKLLLRDEAPAVFPISTTDTSLPQIFQQSRFYSINGPEGIEGYNNICRGTLHIVGHPFYNQPKFYHKRDGLKFCPFDMPLTGASYKQLPFDAGGLAAKT